MIHVISKQQKKYYLNQHKESQHEGVRYNCDQCDYQAEPKSTLKLHKESKHEGVSYCCDKCDFQATKKI